MRFPSSLAVAVIVALAQETQVGIEGQALSGIVATTCLAALLLLLLILLLLLLALLLLLLLLVLLVLLLLVLLVLVTVTALVAKSTSGVMPGTGLMVVLAKLARYSVSAAAVATMAVGDAVVAFE